MLSPSDVAVIQLRRLLLGEVSTFMEGKRPRGSALGATPVTINNPLDKLLPPGVKWQDWVNPVLGAA